MSAEQRPSKPSLTERLRRGFGGLVPPVCDEAANEIERLQRELASFQKANAELALSHTHEPSSGHAFNGWFLSLEEGRQAVLRDDKWMLAEAAFEAGKRASSPPPAGRIERLISAFKQVRADLALQSGTWSNAASYGLMPEDIGLQRVDDDVPAATKSDPIAVTTPAGVIGYLERSATKSVSVAGEPMGDPHPCDAPSAVSGSKPIGELITELEKDPEWREHIDIARKELAQPADPAPHDVTCECCVCIATEVQRVRASSETGDGR